MPPGPLCYTGASEGCFDGVHSSTDLYDIIRNTHKIINKTCMSILVSQMCRFDGFALGLGGIWRCRYVPLGSVGPHVMALYLASTVNNQRE